MFKHKSFIKNLCIFKSKIALSKNGSLFRKLPSKLPKGQKQVAGWLFICSGMVFSMVVLGGSTRLTKSGLSMTSWKFLGQNYPKGEEQWIKEFDRYKQFPEYKRMVQEMSLSEFKHIYFMEYLHRMWGRLLGAVFAGPALYFAARGFINRQIGVRLLGLFALGGSQGLVGWWMVKSGLDEKPHSHLDLPRVSPYRLAVHLISAFGIYVLLLKNGLCSVDYSLLARGKFSTFAFRSRPLRKVALLSTAMTTFTALSGAFVAGNEAGKIYNSFPWMGEPGRIFPTDYFNEHIKEKWKNYFENQACVQFNHRFLGVATFLTSISVLIVGVSTKLPRPISALPYLIGFAAIIQTTIGVYTLISGVPVDAAAIHQSGSLVLLTLAFTLLHLTSPRRYRMYSLFKSLKK